jgi:hypothetical protein
MKTAHPKPIMKLVQHHALQHFKYGQSFTLGDLIVNQATTANWCLCRTHKHYSICCAVLGLCNPGAIQGQDIKCRCVTRFSDTLLACFIAYTFTDSIVFIY